MTDKPDYKGIEVSLDKANVYHVNCQGVPEPFAYRHATTNYPDFAEEIAKRWNAHDELVAALFALVGTERYEGEIRQLEGDGTIDKLDDEGYLLQKCIDDARVLLIKLENK